MKKIDNEKVLESARLRAESLVSTEASSSDAHSKASAPMNPDEEEEKSLTTH